MRKDIKVTKVTVSLFIAALGMLVAILMFSTPLNAWWISAPTAQFESVEPIHTELLEVPAGQGAPGKIQVFEWEVQNLESEVTYGVRYLVTPWFDWGIGGKGGPVENTVRDIEFFIDPSKVNEDGSFTLVVAETTAAAPAPPQPSAKVWISVDGAPYFPGEKVNIGPETTHTLEIRIRPGAESPPGSWNVSLFVDRGEPIIPGKG